ncbi:MAG: molybdenum cofactor guanylyltransferase MobA [Gemmatimonas sp.]|jgi:molybdopterin-guanine dinucleotide biosynthesis protein A|uniref:molybdenum cofactor guanylyltransferase MobA n=1 Tax=Gemmatimonas sp. TaxID=1962908 RepID=UPI00391F3367
MFIPPHAITGIILCGGQARRMGGVDKPLQRLGGTSLVETIRERLAPQVARIIISANRAHEAYGQWGDAVIADTTAALGPLGGLAAVLPHVTTPWFFCCPGDAPFLDRSLVGRLAGALGTASCAIPTDGHRAQCLFLLGPTTVSTAIDAYLASGARSVHGCVAAQQPAVLDASDIADSFRNINSPEELSAAASVPR